MNCKETRRHWNLYYDSEGDAELHFQLNEHLEHCAECANWFDKQNRLESLIEELSAPSLQRLYLMMLTGKKFCWMPV
ncbi:MAG: zf-HC2 domain-containing protein [Planctomycetota bacterium]|nr:zf-HC2 domain-containing protein [Planctomycetota bacterium]